MLVVDDNAMMREGLKALLGAHADIEIVGEASDGSEALERAGELAPDVVVMDMAMPNMNGIEATRLLRERHPAVRVVMLSMHSSPELALQALAAGASAYLLKDAAGGVVLAAVRALGRRAAARCRSTS